jgi:RNA polymerase sigma-70 factor (ECF subfamily)
VDQRSLVERARDGDHDAFAVLAGAALPRLDATARMIVRDAELARDVVQETLFKASRDLPGLRDPDRFDAWLYRLLTNAAISETRRRRRRVVEVDLIPMDAPIPDSSLGLADHDEIAHAFARIAPELRAVIVLCYYRDLPSAEAAAALGVPVGTVKSRLHRAVDAVRAELDAVARATAVPTAAPNAVPTAAPAGGSR